MDVTKKVCAFTVYNILYRNSVNETAQPKRNNANKKDKSGLFID